MFSEAMTTLLFNFPDSIAFRHFAALHSSHENKIMTEEIFRIARSEEGKKINAHIVHFGKAAERIARGTKRRKKSMQNRALKRFFPFCDCIKNAKHSELFITFSLSGRRQILVALHRKRVA